MLSVSLLIALSSNPVQAPTPYEEKIPGTVVSFRMIPLPAGEIEMGGKKHAIANVAISETEVTWDAYDIYAFQLDLPLDQRDKTELKTSRPSKPYGAPDRGFGHNGFPALGIHSNAAIKYCEWLSKKTGKKFRLATEAEWLYAARAGSPTLDGKIDDLAWHYDNTEQTMAVKKKKLNAWGFADMLGNVMEWTIGVDGKPVCRGGSYMDKPATINLDFRKPYDEEWQASDAHTPKSIWWLADGAQVGFRVACDLK